MRLISFGKVAVQNHGVPVHMGQSTLNGSIAASDETITVTSAAPFCQDMCPFKMDIDPTGTFERVMVKSISGGVTFTVQRGVDATTPAAHASGKAVVADFPFAGWRLSNIEGLTGKMYWGTNNLNVSSSVGIYVEFAVPAASATAGAAHEVDTFMPPDDKGNPLTLSDYAMDAAVDGEGLIVGLWQR